MPRGTKLPANLLATCWPGHTLVIRKLILDVRSEFFLDNAYRRPQPK